jgi:hypothetical protein
VDSTGKIFLARTDYFPDNYNPPYYDKIWLSTSSDRGDNWESKILIENEFIGGEPAMKSGENGNVYLICGADEGIYCFFSTDSGSSWQVNQAAGIVGNFWVGQYSSLKIQDDKLFLIRNTQDTTGHRNNNWIHFVSGAVPLDMVTGNTGQIYLVYINITDHSSRTGGIYFIRAQ